jgi:hypothetical protein
MQTPIKSLNRKCKICGKKFTTQYFNKFYCDSDCGYELSMRIKEKNQAKEMKAKREQMKEAIQTTTDLRKLLQIEINAIVRAIDYGQPCISCGREDKKWHCSHYHHKSKNSSYNITFHAWNLHKSCDYCNLHLHGNYNGYRLGIIERYGEDILNLMSDLQVIYKDLTFDKIELKNAINEAKEFKKLLPKEKIYSVDELIELRKKLNQKLGLYDI